MLNFLNVANSILSYVNGHSTDIRYIGVPHK